MNKNTNKKQQKTLQQRLQRKDLSREGGRERERERERERFQSVWAAELPTQNPQPPGLDTASWELMKPKSQRRPNTLGSCKETTRSLYRYVFYCFLKSTAEETHQ